MQNRSRTGILAGLLLPLLLSAEAWPQWRGPNRDGRSKETGLLQKWPEAGPKLLWQVKDLGGGYSTPAVVGDRLYLVGNEGTNREFVLALGTSDGKTRWTADLGKVAPNEGPQYPGARSTPTIDGDYAYVLGSDGDLACLETATGKVRWKKNLRTDFGGVPGNWAFAESPAVDGDKVIVTPGGPEATLVALRKSNGEVVWKCAVPGGDKAGYASIVIAEIGEVRQYIQFLEKGLVGVAAADGKFLWRYDRTAQGSPANIPTPIVQEDYVYSAAGRSGAGLVRVRRTGDAWQAEQVYFTPKLPTAIGGAVLVGSNLYGTTGQALVCADFKSGEIKWEERSIAPGSVCFADGRLYLHGENGGMALVEATPEGYREHGKFEPPDLPERGRTKAWTYPVIADGRLYIHDLGHVWCYDIQAR